MQTFLPYWSFPQTAKVLDDRRLGNQCYRETKTLLAGKWPNHPASKMWRGYEHYLARYGLALAMEMAKRGKWKPEVCERWIGYYTLKMQEIKNTGPPPWLGNADFHASHRSNLLRKAPKHYGQFGWKEPPNLPYVWPVLEEQDES